MIDQAGSSARGEKLSVWMRFEDKVNKFASRIDRECERKRGSKLTQGFWPK